MEKQTALGFVGDTAEKVDGALAELRNGAPFPVDPRWLAIATTKFQEAFMALRRAVHPNNANKL